MKTHLFVVFAAFITGCTPSGGNFPVGSGPNPHGAARSCWVDAATPFALDEVAPNGLSPAAAIAGAQGMVIALTYTPLAMDPSLPSPLHASMTMAFTAYPDDHGFSHNTTAYYVSDEPTFSLTFEESPNDWCAQGLYVPVLLTMESSDGSSSAEPWFGTLHVSPVGDILLIGANGVLANPTAEMLDVSHFEQNAVLGPWVTQFVTTQIVSRFYDWKVADPGFTVDDRYSSVVWAHQSGATGDHVVHETQILRGEGTLQ